MVITAWYAVNWSVSRKWAWPAWPRDGDKVWVLMGLGNKMTISHSIGAVSGAGNGCIWLLN